MTYGFYRLYVLEAFDFEIVISSLFKLTLSVQAVKGILLINKLPVQASIMFKVVTIIIVSIFCVLTLESQVLVKGQDFDTPIYTELREEVISPYNKLFSKKEFSMDKMLAFRSFLKPYALKADPVGMFLYAKTHDLYPYKKGSKKDAAIALEYFTKASDLGLSDASYVLYGHYRNGYMTLPKDSYKSIEYLRKAIKQGDNSIKAALSGGLARLFHGDEGEIGANRSFPAINYSLDSTRYHLTQAIKYNPNNTWAKDYLAEINNPNIAK